MHIKEDLVYNKHTGELVGFVNLGDINTHLLKYEQSLSGVHRQSHWPSQCSPLWFVVSSTSCSFRMPNFHASLFLVIYSTTPSISIVDCYTIGYLLSLIIIYRCGLKVMGVTCDGNSANRRFCKLHSKENAV